MENASKAKPRDELRENKTRADAKCVSRIVELQVGWLVKGVP